MGNQNKKNRISTLYILKLLHRGCSTKDAKHCSFRGAPKFQEKMTFTEAFWVNSGKSKEKKEKKIESGHYGF